MHSQNGHTKYYRERVGSHAHTGGSVFRMLGLVGKEDVHLVGMGTTDASCRLQTKVLDKLRAYLCTFPLEDGRCTSDDSFAEDAIRSISGVATNGVLEALLASLRTEQCSLRTELSRLRRSSPLSPPGLVGAARGGRLAAAQPVHRLTAFEHGEHHAAAGEGRV